VFGQAGFVTRAELARHGVHGGLGLLDQPGELLAKLPVGFCPRRAHGQLFVMQCAGMRRQLVQGLVELFVVKLADEGRVGLAHRRVRTGVS